MKTAEAAPTAEATAEAEAGEAAAVSKENKLQMK